MIVAIKMSFKIKYCAEKDSSLFCSKMISQLIKLNFILEYVNHSKYPSLNVTLHAVLTIQIAFAPPKKKYNVSCPLSAPKSSTTIGQDDWHW